MSLQTELSKTVVQGQKVVSPDKFYHTLQLSTATYNFLTDGGNGPFELPLSVPIPKGAFVLNVMFNIFETPVGPSSIYIEAGDPWFWNITSPNPNGIPWNQGNNPFEFTVGSRVEALATFVKLVFNIPASAGHFSVTFYFVA